MKIRIDGEIWDIDEIRGEPPSVSCGGIEFYVFESADAAGTMAREYWADLAASDPAEFACLVGESTLIAWALGQSAGPGTTQVRSLEEWLDLWLDTPEEHWASYDGNEREIDGCSDDIIEELGFKPTVAYRWN